MLTGGLENKINNRLFATTLVLMGCTTATTEGYFLSSFFIISKTAAYGLERRTRHLLSLVGFVLLANTVSRIVSSVAIVENRTSWTRISLIATHSTSLVVDGFCVFMGCHVICQLQTSAMEEVQHHLKQQVSTVWTYCFYKPHHTRRSLQLSSLAFSQYVYRAASSPPYVILQHFP